MSIKGDIAKEYLRKYNTYRTRTLARKILAENGLVFKNQEEILGYLGYYLRRVKKKGGTKEFVDYLGERTNPFDLPKSHAIPYTPYIIKGEVVGILSDIHIPYHDLDALSTAIKYLKKNHVDTILLNGDIWDCYQASSYQPDPRKRSSKNELVDVNEFLDVLAKHFPKVKIIYKEGNHEERWSRYLITHSRIALGIDEFEITSLLHLAARGIDFVGGRRVMKCGKLHIIHGHEYTGGISQPVNIARGLQLKASDYAMQGHNHRVSSHSIRTIGQKIITTWSLGCLSELTPEYMPLNQWGHGVCVVRVDQKSGEFEVDNRQIINGKVF